MIERCGAALSRPIETSRLCGIPITEFTKYLNDINSDVYIAYFKGLEITISVAKQGASAAQLLAFNMLKDLETEIDD